MVGRDATCDVVIPDGSVSRRHARIEWRGENWAIIDQASANGTFLDSQRVAEAGLRHGQELRLGGLPLKVEIEGEAEDLGATTISAAPAPDATVMQPGTALRPPAPAPVPAPAPPPRQAPPIPAPALPPRPAPARPSTPGPAAAPPHTAGPLPSATASLSPRARISQPAPAPPAPPPPKKGRGPLFWVASGCLGCLGIVVLIAALVAGGFYALTRGPVDAVRGQLAEIKRRDMDEAYARLSEAVSARTSRDAFARAVAEHPALQQHTDARFSFPDGSVHVANARAEVKGFLVTPGGAREPAAFELVHEGGAWRIEAIRIDGQAVLDR
jgi:predicted component of type VI protein secretion system